MAYIYIDQYNALKLYTEYRMKNPDVFEKLPMKEQKKEKETPGYQSGYSDFLETYQKTTLPLSGNLHTTSSGLL